MLQKAITKVGLLLSLFLAFTVASYAQNNAATKRNEAINTLRNKSILILFPKNEAYIKALEANPELKNRVEEKLREQAIAKDSIIDAFKNHFTFSQVFYTTANAEDVKAIRSGDYSAVLNLEGELAQIEPNSIQFILYPFESKNTGANSSSSGFTLEPLHKEDRLPHSFPSNVLKFDGLKFADLQRSYSEVVLVLQRKLVRYLDNNEQP